MAYLVRRPSGSVQIRESTRTGRGPRSRVLASFRGALDDRVLDEAERRASGPFDREGLIARARELGIAWSSVANDAARQLLRRLRRGRRLDPLLAALVQESLVDLPASELAADTDEATEWLGSSDAERGAALRGLLRLSDAIVRGRRTRRDASTPPYPPIHSAPAGS